MLLNVANMSCQHCVQSVTGLLHSLDPNASVAVNLTKAQIVVRGQIAPADALRILADAEYPATLVSLTDDTP